MKTFIKNNRKALIIGTLAALILLGLIFGRLGYFMHKLKGMDFTPPATKVSIATAKASSFDQSIETVGSLKALDGVQVTNQAGGLVEKILFKAGDKVKKGQALIQLDNRTQRANVASAKAALNNAQLSFNRVETLFQKQAIAQSNRDDALSTLQQAQSALEVAQTNLDYTIVKAPFDGQIGIAQVDLGQYLPINTSIANLQTIDPIHVNFYISEQNYAKVHPGQAISLSVNAYPKQTFTGVVSALDASIDNNTKSLWVQAEVKNEDPDHPLVGGMYANVDLKLPVKENVISIPQQAINYNLYGNSIYLVEAKTEKGKTSYQAKLQYITLGQQHKDQVEITKGLKAGQQYVSVGAFKLQDGSTIRFDSANKEGKA